MSRLNKLSPQQISQCLTASSGRTYDIPSNGEAQGYRKAAVLLPLLRNEQAWHLLFIRRALNAQDPHSGQVAFAGGKQEPKDADLQSTALREAQEEIGLDPANVRILGELDFHHSVSGFQITPVVAHIPWPFELVLDQREVASVFTVPLHWLADESNHRIEQRHLPGQQPFPVVFFEAYKGEMLWGATARMTLSLIQLLHGAVR